MTPELRAAYDRITAFIAMRDTYAANMPPGAPPLPDEIAMQINDWHSSVPIERARLLDSDLRTLLAALDPAEQPIPHIPTDTGRSYLANRRRQHPHDHESRDLR
jgi:hypothetical protein